MTNLTQEQIRNAAGFAFWLAADENGEYIQIPGEPFSHYLDDPIPDWLLAALASQLISHVDSMEGHAVHTYPESTQIKRRCGAFVVVDKETDGPNRDDNSIVACTEFLRSIGGSDG